MWALVFVGACSGAESEPAEPPLERQRDAVVDADVEDAGRVDQGIAVDSGAVDQSLADAAAPDAAEPPVDAAVPSADADVDPDAGIHPDAAPPPPDPCQGIADRPEFELCVSAPGRCEGNYLDGSDCQAFCAAAGMDCQQVYEGDEGCLLHDDRPALGCDVRNNHMSDWCVCVAPEACEPDCNGRQCGDDGCGGQCGSCGCGEACVEGACEVGEPRFPRTVQVNRTIVLDEPGVYDYEGVLHEWSGSGRCNQQENQPYILRIAASNVTLRNFAYRGAPDGIHIGTSSDGQGHRDGRPIRNIRLENVTGWACEDALTTQFGVQDVTIVDSRFYPNPNARERDKLLQLNFGDVTIQNSAFDGGDAGVCVMFKGGQRIRIENSCFRDCDRAVNGSTQNGIVGRISTDPSEVYAIGNEGWFPDRALIFWDPWRFLTADGDVHCISEGNTLHDNGIDDMREGASIEYR
jgi:hypothetical protein